MPQEAFTSHRLASSHSYSENWKRSQRRECRASAFHALSPRTQLDPNTPPNKMATRQFAKIQLTLLLTVCVGTFITLTSASDVDSMTVNNVPHPVHHGSFQNGVVSSSTVTILTENEERKCGKHCTSYDKDSEDSDDDSVIDDDERYQDGEEDDNDDDDDLDEDNGIDFVDQRQNGTENYRIKVSGLLLIITPPEMPMPTPTPSSTEAPPLTPPTPPSNQTNTTSWSGVKKRFNVRRHDQSFLDQQKRKL